MPSIWWPVAHQLLSMPHQNVIAGNNKSTYAHTPLSPASGNNCPLSFIHCILGIFIHCIRLHLTDFCVKGYANNLMDVNHFFSLKPVSKADSGTLVENSSQNWCGQTSFSVAVGVASNDILQDVGGSAKVAGMT